MRRAMYEAEVGDDVFGEDPTVNRLQEAVADVLGKEAALFVTSGMMGNQLGIGVNTRPGDEVIVERSCHIFNYESGAAGALSGVTLNVLEGDSGLLSADQVRAAIRKGDYWESRSRLLCLENTLNKAGGIVYPIRRMKELTALAYAHGLRTHLDGARLWNATAASGIPERNYAANFDSITVCLSKGLGAPVGSVFAGTKEVVRRAHRMRKLLGGGMRQAGILAAAGLYALAHHKADLAHDHAKAKRLADGLRELSFFSVGDDAGQSNIVMFDVRHGGAQTVLDALMNEGVAMVQFGPTTIRATTHRDVSMPDIVRTVDILRRLYG